MFRLREVRSPWPSMLLLAVVLVGGIATAASDEAGSPVDQYRVLDWTDLVPEGWEPALVAKAYDDEAANDVDEAAVVKDLDQQLAALPGYMKPVVYNGNEVSEFLLVPYLPHQITAHAHLDPNQMVYVYSHEPIIVEDLYQPIWVVGAISTESVMTDEGPAAYRMVEAVTTEYEY